MMGSWGLSTVPPGIDDTTNPYSAHQSQHSPQSFELSLFVLILDFSLALFTHNIYIYIWIYMYIYIYELAPI